MKQYCRYCANAIPYDNDICFCSVKNQMRDKSVCVKANKCKSFELNEIDVFDYESDRRYQPRVHELQAPILFEQMKI